MHLQADLAGDVLLGLVDEGVQVLLQRGEPLTVVDQLGPALVHGLLEPCLLALQGDVLQLAVGGHQGHRPGGLVDLAGLDAHQAVLDDVDPTDPLGTGAAVELLDDLQRGEGLTVQRHRDACVEGDVDDVGGRREGRVLGVVVDVLGGTVPDVLQEAGLHGAAPDVLVDGEGILLGGLDRQVVLLCVFDGLLTGQGQVAHRGDALQLRAEGLDGDLEADLVVALAGAAVGHRGGAELLGGGHQVLGDDRPGDG